MHNITDANKMDKTEKCLPDTGVTGISMKGIRIGENDKRGYC